jgi:hypothetical protein
MRARRNLTRDTVLQWEDLIASPLTETASAMVDPEFRTSHLTARKSDA